MLALGQCWSRGNKCMMCCRTRHWRNGGGQHPWLQRDVPVPPTLGCPAIRRIQLDVSEALQEIQQLCWAPFLQGKLSTTSSSGTLTWPSMYVWQWRWWLRWRWQWRWLQWRWQWCAKSAAVSIQGQHSGEAGLKFFPQRREKAQLSLLEYNDDNIMITAFQKGAFTTQVNNPHQQSITPLQSYNVTTSSSRDISSSPVFTFSLIFKIGLKLGSIQAILKSRSCLTSLVESNVWQCLKTEHEGTRGDRTTCAHVWPRILTWKLVTNMIVYIKSTNQ